MNEVFFPDDDNIKLYTSLIKSQGVDICRQQISRSWIDTSIADCSFGIANYSIRAQIGQKKTKNNHILNLRSLKTPPSSEARAVTSDEDDADCAFSMRNGLKGFILCRVDIQDPEVLWIDMVCASETSKFGLSLMQEAEKIAIQNTVIRRLALFSLAEKKLVNWYTKQGFVHNSVRFMGSDEPKAYIMMKPLYSYPS